MCRCSQLRAGVTLSNQPLQNRFRPSFVHADRHFTARRVRSWKVRALPRFERLPRQGRRPPSPPCLSERGSARDACRYLCAPSSGTSTRRARQAHRAPFAAFSVVSEDDEDGAFWHRRTIATYGFGIVRAHAYCCLECVTEDRVLGYSYWRVHHQLPGTYHCPIHGCRLHRITRTYLKFG